jgi:hypothetical protein
MDRIGTAEAGPVLHEVRTACRRVATDAELVRIDAAARDDLADRLAAELNEQTGLKPESAPTPGPPGDPWAIDPDGGTAEERARLALILAAIAFGSGYHDHLRKRPGCSGATSMAWALRDWAAVEPLTAGRLSAVSAAEAHVRFDQPLDGGPDDEARAELMALFARALRELGTHVLTDHGGSFARLVAAARSRAANLVVELGGLACFADVARYRGRPVPFYKRAQLAAADLHRAFAGRAPADFGDLAALTAFADNLVPHVLRIEGVLRYDADLAARIDAGRPLASGSPEEVEIRAAGVHAVEELCTALAGRGAAIRACDLDGLLWRRGAAARYKAVPRHRTRTVYY